MKKKTTDGSSKKSNKKDMLNSAADRMVDQKKEQLENEKIKLQKCISMCDREIAKLKKMKDDAKLKGDKQKLKVAKRLLKIQKKGRKFFQKEFATREELLNEYKN